MAKRRAKSGSSASKWRDLKESDMLQYMASSDSDSGEDLGNNYENDGDDSDNDGIKSKDNKNN